MISKVIKDKLCANCGTCISVCPVEAINFVIGKNNFEIRVNEDECIKCGSCLKVCPGFGVDFEKLNQKIFKNDKNLNYDPYLGYFRNCYLGYSLNKEFRFQCSSGGVVTSILVYLLKNKIIDGVLVTKMDSKNPLFSKPFIAYSEQEIFEARGSKYTPVVLNQCVREIISSKKENFAVVGLPCHIQGIRKFQEINPILKRKIKFCLGLFCGQEVNFWGTKFILKRMKIKPDEVKKIFFRGEGWPGNIVIENKKREVKRIYYPDGFKIFNLGFFTPERCFLCIDFTNELADISFGDAWLSRLIKKGEGFNFIISRTQRGEKLLNDIKKDLFLKKISSEKIIKSVRLRLLVKKDSYQFLKKIARFLNLGIPHYIKEPEGKFTIFSPLIIIFYLNSYLSNRYPQFFLKIPLIFWNFFLFNLKKIINLVKNEK